MPGLTVVDGTPRDCPSAGCGAQDDTAVIRANELGTSKASALGRSKADGLITATKMMAVFMDGASGNVTARGLHEANSLYRRQLFGGGKATTGSVKTPGKDGPSTHVIVYSRLTLASWNL
jgi:Egh16-like virulence factor